MNKASPLSFEEHVELARAIREFHQQLCRAVFGRYLKKSKITQATWRLNRNLDELISKLDDDFCGQFPEQQVYHSSPYYGGGKTVVEEIAEQRANH